MNLFQYLRDIRRLSQIVDAFTKAGFGFVIKKLGMRWCGSFLCRIKCFMLRKQCPVMDMPRMVRQTFENLGPTFIKLGQVLSMRSDFIPKEYVEEFKKLQDAVPQLPFESIKRILEDEFHQPMFDTFESFDHVPLASASLGQVHKAILKTGETVAVKIQRPGIRKTIDADMRLLMMVARKAEKRIPELQTYRPTKAIEEFVQSLKRELDYMVEGRNADRFRYNFRDEKGVKIPKIFWQHTTSKILTMEFIEGVRMGDLEKMSKKGINHAILTKNCTRACILPVMSYGFFHADPHPGNVWVLEDNKVCLLDFGMVGILDKELRRIMLVHFLFLIYKDIDAALYYLLKMAAIGDGADVRMFREEATSIIISYYESLSDSSGQTLTKTFYSIIMMGIRFGVYFPSELIMLAKAMITGEAMCQMTHPKFDMLETSKPIITEIVFREMLDFKKLFSSFAKYAPEFFMNLEKKHAT